MKDEENLDSLLLDLDSLGFEGLIKIKIDGAEHINKKILFEERQRVDIFTKQQNKEFKIISIDGKISFNHLRYTFNINRGKILFEAIYSYGRESINSRLIISMNTYGPEFYDLPDIPYNGFGFNYNEMSPIKILECLRLLYESRDWSYRYPSSYNLHKIKSALSIFAKEAYQDYQAKFKPTNRFF